MYEFRSACSKLLKGIQYFLRKRCFTVRLGTDVVLNLKTEDIR